MQIVDGHSCFVQVYNITLYLKYLYISEINFGNNILSFLDNYATIILLRRRYYYDYKYMVKTKSTDKKVY